MSNLLPSSFEAAGPSHSCPTRGHYNFRKPLHQSASCESCNSMLLLGDEPSAKREAPPSRKRKVCPVYVTFFGALTRALA